MDDERMTDADVTLAQIRAYLAAHNWTRQSDPDFPSDDVWRHPGYGDYPDDGILLPDRDGAEVLGRTYTAGVLKSLARFEGRCEHEVLADMLGEIDMATALAEIERLRNKNRDLRAVIADEHSRLSQKLERESEYKRLLAENAAFRSGMVPRTLTLGLACVNCHQCVGVFVTQEALDNWARDNGWRDGWCPDCLTRPDTCDQRDRDDDEREDGDDD